MKNLLIALISILLVVQKNNAQQNYAVGVSFGLGKSFFNNEFPTDNDHYNFEDPTSIAIGTQLVKNLDANNQLVLKLGYTSKKIKFEYNLNEPTIPLKVNETMIDKYNCLSISAGYRKPFKIRKLNLFAEVDLVADYNSNDAQATEGTMNDDFSVPFDGPISYHFSGTDNVGRHSITIGSTVAVGCKFGKRKHSELSLHVNIPFNDIQKKTSTYHYSWEYQGKVYNHYLNYKGSIIYPSIIYTLYVFNK
jgi:hypothetical protein